MAVVVPVNMKQELLDRIDKARQEMAERTGLRVARAAYIRLAITTYLAGLAVGNTGRESCDN